MGIIVNEGIKQPTLRVDRLHFAAGTPYETLLDAKPAAPERVLAPEVAQTVRRALIDVVENGTARRAHNAFTLDGKPLVVGGKTGTGDHRFDRYGPGGKLIDSRVVERWRPGDTRPEILPTELIWQPEPTAPALTIDLTEYFAYVWDE